MTDRYSSFDDFLASFQDRVPENDWSAAETFVANIPPEYREQFLSFLRTTTSEGSTTAASAGAAESEISTGASHGSSIAMDRQSTERVAHFNVLRRISRGGMGVVYVAQDVHSDELVALKMLRRAVRGENAYERRLRRESQAIAALDHPHIVRLVDTGIDQESTYLAMQLVDGVGLDQVVQYWVQDQNGTGSDDARPDRDAVTTPVTHASVASCAFGWSEDRFVAIAEHMALIAEALQSAHDQNICHRDVKPSNILIDIHGKPWLTDFGLASVGADVTELTQTGDVIGTPAYMSPEQASGNANVSNHLSDVYSLGATIYELATLRKPFVGSRQKIIVDLIKGVFPLPSKLQPAIPRQLEAIICRAMALSPKDRYQSAGDLATDLRNFAEGHKVHAKLPSRTQEFIRWCERNPTTTLVAAVAILLIIAAGFSFQAYNTWSVNKVNERVRRSNEQLVELNDSLDRNKQRLRRELFVADLSAAFDAYNKDNVQSFRLLMNRYDMDGEDRDLRGIAWNLLSQLTRSPESEILLQHDGPAKQIAISPTQDLILTAGHDGFVRTIQLDSAGRRVGEDRKIEVGSPLDSLAFDPIDRAFYVGRSMLLGFNRASKYSLESGQPVDSDLLFQNCVESIAVSPNGKSYAAAERYRNTAARTESGEVVNWANGSRNGSLEFLDDENVIGIFQDEDIGRRLHIWNLKTNKSKVLKTPFPVENFATAREELCDPPIRFVAAGPSDICVFEWPSMKLVGSRKRLSVRFRCLDISSDGNKIVAGCDDGTVFYWDLSRQRNRKLLDTPQIVQAGFDKITDIKFLDWKLESSASSPSQGVAFLTASDDGEVRRWSLPEQLPSIPLWKYGGTVEDVIADPSDPKAMYVAFSTGHLVCVDIVKMSVKALGKFDRGFMGTGVCWPEGDRLFVSCPDEILAIDRSTGRLVGSIPTMFSDQECDGIVVVGREAFASYHDHVLVFDPESFEHKKVHMLPTDSADQILRIPGSETLIVRTDQALYSIRDGSLAELERSNVSSEEYDWMAYSENGKLLATVHHNHRIRVSQEGQEDIALAGGEEALRGLIFVDDDRTLVSSDTGGNIRFWDLESRREVGRFASVLSPPNSIRYVPELNKFVALGRNRLLHVWDVGANDSSKIASAVELESTQTALK